MIEPVRYAALWTLVMLTIVVGLTAAVLVVVG